MSLIHDPSAIRYASTQQAYGQTWTLSKTEEDGTQVWKNGQEQEAFVPKMVETVRAEFRTALISRTTFENQPAEKQHRVQQWVINDQDKFKSPESTARFIADYWKRRRAVADGTLVAPATSYPTVLASFLTNTTNVKLSIGSVDRVNVIDGAWADVNLAHACGLYSDPIVIPESQLQIHDEISYDLPFDKMAEVADKIAKYWNKRMYELLVDCAETCKVDSKIEKKFDGSK